MAIQTAGLTRVFGDNLERQIDLTHPGMAFFANTGPDKICGQCASFEGNRKTGRCAKYQKLTQRKGPPFPRIAKACKYFEARS